jgi:hypothetical protein
MPLYVCRRWFLAMETNMFKNNVGLTDRVIRIFIGVVLLVAFFIYPNASWRYWTLIGIIPLITGAVGSCPLYSLLGLSTCPTRIV